MEDFAAHLISGQHSKAYKDFNQPQEKKESNNSPRNTLTHFLRPHRHLSSLSRYVSKDIPNP